MLLHWFKSLFKDELWVFVYPQCIVLLRITRPVRFGLKQQILYKQVIELPQAVTDNVNESQAWGALMQHLKQVLADKKWQNTIPIAIVSNQFARYTVIPWNAELAVEAERKAYMQHCFSLAYGEAAKTWDLRMSEPSYGHPAIASGIHHGLLQALHDVFNAENMTLSAVYPQLMLAINQTVSEVKKQKKPLSFWLVAIQSERLCLTLLIEGGWRLVKNVAIETDISAQVSALIQREMVSGNMTNELPVLVYWPEYQRNQLLTLVNNKAIKVLPHQFDMQSQQVLSAQSLALT
ncbi:hypothetical protein [Methylotenera sp.]|uniref:hypothetical protein n=1 Tax=Methylotenera sp. TaxID=2051956 RepID=UPI00248A5614|nr:hypothetical protein [Methylotenera sp.]MDI1298716.1 hypothetical protein [Methylotenera sp.]